MRVDGAHTHAVYGVVGSCSKSAVAHPAHPRLPVKPPTRAANEKMLALLAHAWPPIGVGGVGAVWSTLATGVLTYEAPVLVLGNAALAAVLALPMRAHDWFLYGFPTVLSHSRWFMP